MIAESDDTSTCKLQSEKEHWQASGTHFDYASATSRKGKRPLREATHFVSPWGRRTRSVRMGPFSCVEKLKRLANTISFSGLSSPTLPEGECVSVKTIFV
jgi:hypothetical protein